MEGPYTEGKGDWMRLSLLVNEIQERWAQSEGSTSSFIIVVVVEVI
jgi:hypothetical protein